MMDMWMAQRMAEERRRDLARVYDTGRARRVPTVTAVSEVTAPKATVLAHPVGPTVGAWLIRAGTRLGGASIRASH
jgi:hypothetical protein